MDSRAVAALIMTLGETVTESSVQLAFYFTHHKSNKCSIEDERHSRHSEVDH